MRRLARAAPVEPLAVAQLVALPRLADGEPGQEGEQRRRAAARSPFMRARALPDAKRSDDGVPAALGAQDQFEQLPGGAASARRRRDPVHALADLRDGVGRRGGQAHARQHGDVHDVIAHVGDFVVVQADVAHDFVVRLDLARHALMHQRDAELRGALGRGGRHAGRQQADLQPDALRPDHDDAVPDVELLAFAAVAMQHDPPVRQDAVDVEQDQPDARGPLINCQVSSLKSGIQSEICNLQCSRSKTFPFPQSRARARRRRPAGFRPRPRQST